MKQDTIIDTGPLVAFLDANEEHHAWVTKQFQQLPPSFLTCEAVLTETCYLLSGEPKAIEAIERFLRRGWLKVTFQFAMEFEEVMSLMRTYRSLPMSLADACVVRMAELNEGTPVCTLDKHFRVYRMNERKSIPTIMPP